MATHSYPLFGALLAALLLTASGCGGGGGGSGGGGPGDPEIDPGRTPDPGTSEFLVAPEFGTPADGETSVAIQVHLVSLTGHPIGNAKVDLEISGRGNVWQPLPPTDVEGRTQGTLASTVGEKKTVVARTTSGGRQTTFTARTTEFLLIPEDTFFVRKSGSDTNSGRSPRDAWQTLAHALAEVDPGATVYVGAGTYPGPLAIERDSRAGNPLVVWGDRSGVMTSDAGAVVIEGGDAEAALTVRASHNVVVQGLTLRGAQTGLRIADSSDVLVLACRPQENEQGIVIDGADGLTVQDCRISANLVDGVRVVRATHTRIENNLVYANIEDGLVLFSSSDGTDIRFNTFYRNGHNHLLEEEPGGSGAIEANILTEGGSDPIALLIGSDYQTGPNMVWANTKPGPSRGLPLGSIEADPLFVDPFGPDGILGGPGADDDDFRLEPGSVANDLGESLARDVVLGSHESLATRLTRSDGVLEDSGSDLASTNLGYHWSEPAPDFRSLERGGARIAFAPHGDVHLHTQAWDRAVPAAASAVQGPSLDADVLYLEQRLSPLETCEELVAAQIDTGTRGRIVVRHWDGRQWTEPALAPFQDGIPREQIADKRFDVEYESLSGNALLVVADGDSIPSYRVLEHGRWSPFRPVTDLAVNEGSVSTVELVPHRGTNEIALLTLDDRRDLAVTLWDGQSWGPQKLVSASTIYAPSWRPFDGAFETFSGDFVVIWGFSRFAEEARWATLERRTGQWRFGHHPSTEAVGADIKLASDPASDRIALVMGEADFDNDVTVSIWNGSDWIDTAELTLAGPIENRANEIAWLGSTGVAQAYFRRQGHTGSFVVAKLQPTGWKIQPDVALPGVDKAAQIRLVSQPDAGRLLGLVLDLRGRLFEFRYDGREYTLLNGGQPVATGFDPLARGRPFDVAISAAPPPASTGR